MRSAKALSYAAVNSKRRTSGKRLLKMIGRASFVCIVPDDVAGRIQNDLYFAVAESAAKDRKMLALNSRRRPEGTSWRCVTIQQLFLSLYRENKLGGSKTEMFLSHEEHLIAVQLALASWNKKKRGSFEADAQSVLKVSRAILKEKMKASLPHLIAEQSGPSSPVRTSNAVTVQTSRTIRGTPNISPLVRSGSKGVTETVSEKCAMSPHHSLKSNSMGFPTTPQTGRSSKFGRQMDSPKTPLREVSRAMVLGVLLLYNDFISKSGKVDALDVLCRVKDFYEQNGNDLSIFRKEHLLVIDRVPRDEIEREMLKCLVGDDPVCCISLNKIHAEGLRWDEESLPGGRDIFIATVPLPFLWKSNVTEWMSQGAETDVQGTSVSETFIRKLFLSYISLLVNSADELALARCLCLPDRALSHEGFTALKHLAAKKKMSMFLTAFSFVFEIRREKATSDSYRPLFEHTKSLTEFVDIADKLLTITQDVADVDLASRKVLKTLKSTLSKSRTCSFRQSSVQKVCDKLLEETKHLLEVEAVNLDITPKPVGAGGSMRGQKVLKLFRSLLDIEATNISQNQGQDELADQQASQGTPVTFPSLLSQFRSPSVPEPHLSSKLNEEAEDPKTKTPVSYTKSHLGWLAPSMMINVDDSPPLSDGFRSFPPVAKERRPSTEVLREISDNKNAVTNNKDKDSTGDTKDDVSDVGEVSKLSRKATSTPVAGKVNKDTRKKPPLKRKKLHLEASTEGKKAKAGKKKCVPLPKGQSLLTNFFRKPSVSE